MAKARLFDLPETKGTFQVKGKVSGVDKDKFYEEKLTQNRKQMRRLNFGVEVDEKQTVYMSNQGMPQDFVYFSKQTKKDEAKEPAKKVAWGDRFSWKKDKYRLIGMNVGLKKVVDSKGNTVNDKRVMTEFDACLYASEHLKDGDSVFIKGKIEFSSFTDDNNTKRNFVKQVPTQISLCSKVEFDKDDFKATSDFTQTIVYMGIDQEKVDEKATGRFLVQAKIITYSTIEDAEFVVVNPSLAKTFKKNLKPYTGLNVWGNISSSVPTEEVVVDNGWGEENAMTKVNASAKREFVITGADSKSVDTTTFPQAKIEEAIVKIAQSKKAETDFADVTPEDNVDEGWGSSLGSSSDDDDEDW